MKYIKLAKKLIESSTVSYLQPCGIFGRPLSEAVPYSVYCTGMFCLTLRAEMMRKAELFDKFQTNNKVKLATKDTVINEVANTKK